MTFYNFAHPPKKSLFWGKIFDYFSEFLVLGKNTIFGETLGQAAPEL
jgi:hypothetical protein